MMANPLGQSFGDYLADLMRQYQGQSPYDPNLLRNALPRRYRSKETPIVILKDAREAARKRAQG